MTESEKIQELELKVQQLQAKVFRNQNLDISNQLKTLSARQQAENISDGAKESNLDEKNPDILRSEIKNLRLSLTPQTKQTNPRKFYEMVGRVKEIETTLLELGESLE